MKKYLFPFLGLSLSLVLFSCKKKETEEEPHEPNSATISITQPAEAAQLAHADTLRIRGTIVSLADMHGYNVRIQKVTDQAQVFYFEDHYHGMNKNLNVNWPCDLNENLELRLTVTAILDHDGNTASRSLDFHCHP